MRRFLIIISIVAFAGAGAACMTVEHVGRPPSAVEIARINDTVAHGRGLVIEPPIDVIRVEPVAACPGGSCGPPSPRPRRPARRIPRTIVSTDAEQMTFNTKLGDTMKLPLDAITGVRVTGADRGGSAALGAFLGVAGAAVLWGVVALLAQHWGEDDPDVMGSSGCEADCEKFIAGSVAAAMIAGGIAGAAIGAPHRFLFGAPKAVEAPVTP